MAYVSAAEFQNSVYYAGLEEFFTNNAMVTGFLEDMSAIVDNYCGRHFLQKNYTDKFGGNDRNGCFLSQMPVNSISSISYYIIGEALNTAGLYYPITVDAASASGVIDPTTYHFTREGMVKSNIPFSSRAIWTIQFNAGYSSYDLPREIKTATMMLAKVHADSVSLGNIGDPSGGTLNEFQFGKFREKYAAGNLTNLNATVENIPPTIGGILRRFRLNRGI